MRHTICLLLSTVLLSMVGINSYAQNNYSITGKIHGVKSGELLVLVAKTGQQTDTVGRCTLHGEDFKIEGHVDQAVYSTVMLAGFEGGFSLFVEPGCDYTADLSNSPLAKIEGGNLQTDWLLYRATVGRFNSEAKVLRDQVDSLRNLSHFRSASKINDQLEQLRLSTEEELRAIIDRHADDVFSAHLLYANAMQQNVDLPVWREVYESLSPNAKATVSGELIAERIAFMESTAKGASAPDFTLTDLNGKEVSLSQIDAKLIIIDFWASWCGPCRLNNPSLRAIYEQYHQKGLEVVGISLDTKRANWSEAVEKDQLEWINLSSLEGWKCPVAKLYNVTEVPTMFVLDADRNIVAKGLRDKQLSDFISERLN